MNPDFSLAELEEKWFEMGTPDLAIKRYPHSMVRVEVV